jgi:hypothetical protein
MVIDVHVGRRTVGDLRSSRRVGEKEYTASNHTQRNDSLCVDSQLREDLPCSSTHAHHLTASVDCDVLLEYSEPK